MRELLVGHRVREQGLDELTDCFRAGGDVGKVLLCTRQDGEKVGKE